MIDAITSWFNTVYLPVVNVIEHQHIMKRFPHRTVSDMYVWIIKYWDNLKKKFGQDFSLDKAASDFTEKYGKSFRKSVVKTFLNILAKVQLKKEIE